MEAGDIRKMVLARLRAQKHCGLAGTTLALKALSQTAVLVALARALGVHQLGQYITLLAAAAIVFPFAAAGYGPILVRNVSRDRTSAAKHFGSALTCASCVGCPLAIVAAYIDQLMPSNTLPIGLLALFFFTELVFAKVPELVVQLGQGLHDFRFGLAANAAYHGIRIVAVYGYCIVAKHTLEVWLGISFVTAGVASTAILLFLLNRGFISSNLVSYRELKEGMLFGLGMTAKSAYVDLDKLMLTIIIGASATGVYGAAYKIVSVFLLPVSATLMTVSGRLFRSGALGLDSVIKEARRMLPMLLILGLLCGTASGVVGKLAEHWLGNDYRGLGAIAALLGGYAVLFALSSLLADVLTSAGHQGGRTLCQSATLAINYLANLALIPRIGAYGAAVSTLLAETLLIAGLLIVTCRLRTNNAIRRLV